MINKQPQISFVYNRRRTASTNKKASVEIRITHNGKQKYLSTGVLLYPYQWKKGQIVNCPDALQLSQILDKQLTDVRKAILDMINEDKLNISQILEKVKKNNQEILTFLTFCIQRAAIRKYGKKQDTRERYERFIKLFSQWGVIVKFEDVTETNIISYDTYLTSKGMKPYSKWNNYHRFLNSFIIDAIDEGYLNRNPYKWLNIEKDKGTTGISKYLTLMEFRKIKTSRMPTLSLEKVRDIFVFQTYTCLSYTDLRDFDARQIQEVKGMKVYLGNRQKTDKPFTIPILSSAWDIIMKYEGQLPIISNVKYNEYLKLVAQAAGIDKPISSHWARHTGATLLLNEGVDMKIVSKICGHSSIKITEQVYAKLLDETVVDAIKNIKLNLK